MSESFSFTESGKGCFEPGRIPLEDFYAELATWCIWVPWPRLATPKPWIAKPAWPIDRDQLTRSYGAAMKVIGFVDRQGGERKEPKT